MARSQTWEEQLAGGPLNQPALEQLRDSFDTYRLLDAVDAVDAIRYRLCEPDQVRDDLLHLHDVASALINAGGLNGRGPRQPIWSLAGDLSLELGELADRLQAVADTLEELVGLAPGEDQLFHADGSDDDDEEGDNGAGDTESD
jgi:hypothetical protein